MPFTVLSIIGTRPEAIKLAPVIDAVSRHADLRSQVVITAQDRDLLDRTLGPLGIAPDVDLDIMRPGHTLAELSYRVLGAVDLVLASLSPDLVLVQGDTTSALMASLAAFYQRIPVGYVEAGLRTFDVRTPFLRRLTGSS